MIALFVTATSAHAQTGPAAAMVGRATQLVVVTTTAWDSTTGVLHRFERRNATSSWRETGAAIPVVIGRTGLARGVGLENASRMGGGPSKHEGDGRSPAGVFAVGTAFGFPPPDSMKWLHLPYTQLSDGTDCVDDTGSVHYNQVVDRGRVARVDWGSAEHMRTVHEYELGAVILYNSSPPVKSRGSCIFFHIWNGPRSVTAGCTAMDRAQLTTLLAWLEPRRRPVLVQLPADAYARMRRGWKLPALSTLR